MSDKKQTAVQWYKKEMDNLGSDYMTGKYTPKQYDEKKAEIENQALAMEREQIAKSVQWYLSGVMDEESALNEGYKFYNQAFERAYGVDEPDYNNVTIRNRNPDYKP